MRPPIRAGPIPLNFNPDKETFFRESVADATGKFFFLFWASTLIAMLKIIMRMAKYLCMMSWKYLIAKQTNFKNQRQDFL
jgi:hypothetical protein